VKVGLISDWGFDNFRDRQLEICTEVMKGNDVFVNAPTGLGKS
jgi:superfamily II DNA helicase RecQ